MDNMPQKEKILLSAIGIFFALLAASVIAAVVFAPSHPPSSPVTPIACPTLAKLCPDGSSVSPIGPNCEFAPCPFVSGDTQPIVPTPKPAPTPVDAGDTGVACTMDAKRCADGTYVGRVAPKCNFAACPTSTPSPQPISGTSGSCKSNSDCAVGYSCEDISPVVREGTQNLRCWKNGSPRPICLSGETRIGTPSGDVLVKNMKGGEVVWSVNARGEKIAVPVLIAAHTEAPLNHHVIHLVLADGREFFVSPGHPVADGRPVGSLKKGDTLDGSIVTKAELILYNERYTYDILPDSDTGMYVANGIVLQSTLRK